MYRNTVLALAGAAALALGAGAASAPALANYSYCSENPSLKGCPGDFNVKDEAFYVPPTKHSEPAHRSAERHPEQRTQHHRG